jgi:uncharacterized protein YbjT (DUF2867 family)
MTTTRLIATTAPSGNVGRHVVHDLVRAGVRPRVLAHRPESLDPALADLVDLRVVDLGDAAALEAALDGVAALFVTIPSPWSDDPLGDYGRHGAAVTSASAAAGVERVVLQSSVGAELRVGAGEIDGLAAVEQMLDDAPLSVVHLRCGFFFTNLVLQLDQLRTGEVPVVLPTDQPLAWVAPADIAAVAVGWLLRDDWSGRHVQAVHGPADLSWDDAARVVSAATGHELRATRVGDDEMRAGMVEGAGMPEAMADAILGMSTGMRDGFVPEQPRDATSTTPTTLGAWSYDVLRPLLTAG